MSQIRDTFDPSKNINRRIEKVISYAAADDQRLKAEVSEYVVTESIQASFETLLDRMNQAMEDGGNNDIGVWVSGFYGSGKSSFTKYLGFGLDPGREIEGHRFLDVFLQQFNSPQVKALFQSAINKFPAVVIHVDLGADQIAGATLKEISTVLYLKSLAYVGYSSADMKVALLEMELDGRGKYDEFKEAVKQKGHDWNEIQNNPLAGNAIAAQLAPELLPDLYPTEVAFQAQSMAHAKCLKQK